MKKKLSRDEKRRVRLAERPASGEVLAKVVHMNKRVTAFFVALVVLLAMIPAGVMLHVKAGAADQLDPVTMWVRVNGVDNWDKVTVNPGLIEDNISDVAVDNLPEGAEFIKAVIIDHDTKIETEIKSLGAIGDDYYYSLNEEANSGTKLLDNEELILIYGNRYRVTANSTGSGEYTIVAHEDDQGYYLWAKEDLEIKTIEPELDYSIDSVLFKSGSSNGSVDVVKGTATVPYTKIKGDITVNIDFTYNSTYSITEGDVAQGDICQEQGHEDYSQETFESQAVDPVSPGDNAQFLVYSQSWTGGDAWVLNQLTLNGEDLKIPTSTTVGDYAETTLADGTQVRVELIKVGEGLYWKDGDADYHEWGIAGEPGTFDKWNKQRCIYQVTISDVHKNYVVDGNFKDSSRREVIIKGLEGIDQTGAALEDMRLISGFSVAQRYYTFTTSNKNIYTANYTNFLGESTFPSDNLILYTVQYGYNPYSVETRMSYDGGETYVDNVREFAEVGSPVEVIAGAANSDESLGEGGRYDSTHRHWGKNTVLKNKESTYRPAFSTSSKDLLLTTISKDTTNTWYAVAINQSSEKNQWLELNAKPYTFLLNVDVKGNLEDATNITFNVDSSRFDQSGTTYIEKETKGHTVVGDQPYFYLPDTPTKDGYIFEYWQLYDANGNLIENKKNQKSQYAALDQFALTEENVALVMGDIEETNQPVYFKAVWSEVAESSKAMVEINAFQQVSSATTGALQEQSNSKYYSNYYTQQEIQNVGKIALLNMHAPANSEYYVLNEDLSNLTTTVTQQEDITVIPDDNKLSLYYDYKTVSLDLQKVVKGKPKSTEYEITLTLIKNPASPVSIDDALTMMGLTASSEGVTVSENSITIKRTYGKNSKIEFATVPYNWDYEVNETESSIPDDYTASYEHSGTLGDNTKIIVTNTGDNPGIETEKALTDNGDGTYNIDLAAYATGESYTEQLDANVPLDIALVLDQSGSMMTSDVYDYTYVDENGSHQTAWTVSEATGKYVKVGTKYYPVEQYSTDAYTLMGHRGDYLPYDMTTGFKLFSNGAATNYYAIVDGSFKQLYVETSGYMAGFSGHSHGVFNVTYDPQYIAGGGYHLYLKYYNDNGNKVTLQTYEGWDEADYKADTIVTDFITTYRLGADTYQKVTVYGLRYKDSNGNYIYLSQPSTTTTETDGGIISYITDNTTVYDTSTDVTFVDASGRINEAGQTLFTRTATTRLNALKTAVNAFAQAVGEQAEAKGVDHRIAVIGYANNEIPGISTSAGKIIGDSKFVTTNTGLFVNGQFKNYLTPDLSSSGLGTRVATSTSSLYSNLTYFATVNSAMNAFHKDGNYWDRFYADGDVLSSYYNSSYSYDFYYPSVTSLTESQYQQALVSVNENDTNSNKVNDYIDTAVDTVSAYGATYLPYGLAMANNVFKYNDNSATETTKERKRVIIVFTDGEPGWNGYDQTIANESLAAADIAKDTYGASVYTVGLYPSSTTSTVTDFMHQLSSEYFTSTTDIYGEELSSSDTYYFNDEDGRTHSVTVRNNGNKSNIGFDKVQHGNRVIPVTNDNYSGAVSQYSWVDSDGWVRAAYYDETAAEAAKTTAGQSNDPYYNMYQYFTVGTPSQASNDTYYYAASDKDELKDVFETISTQLQHPTTTVKLDAYNSLMKDGLSEYFEKDANTNVTLTTYDATESNINSIMSIASSTTHEDRIAAIKQLSRSSTSADGAQYSWDNNYLNVNGFDYSSNYIGSGKTGKILVATIQGVKLKEGVVGTALPSNTDDSGVYVKKDDGDKLVAEFNKPTTNANAYSANVTLQYVGNDNNTNVEGQRFNVTFKLTKSDGTTPYTGTIGTMKFSSTGEFNTTMKTGDVKSITGIPKDAILSVTVSDPDNANTYYTYAITDTLVDEDGNPIYEQDGTTQSRGSITPSGAETTVGQVSITRDHPDILISVVDNRQVLTVTNHTQGHEGEADFSDRTKKFPTKLTLYKLNSTSNEYEAVTNNVTFLNYAGDNITFENGAYETELGHEESIILFVPEGYKVKVEDDSGLLTNYDATYKMDAETTADEIPREPVFDASSSDSGHTVDIYHTIHSIVISGIMDALDNVNPFVWVALGIVASAAAAGYVVLRRRRART